MKDKPPPTLRLYTPIVRELTRIYKLGEIGKVHFKRFPAQQGNMKRFRPIVIARTPSGKHTDQLEVMNYTGLQQFCTWSTNFGPGESGEYYLSPTRGVLFGQRPSNATEVTVKEAQRVLDILKKTHPKQVEPDS